MWNGTPESVIDLHPDGFSHTQASDIYGNSQVGYGTIEGVGTHALLWKGSRDNVVDLHPPGFAATYAYAVSGNVQVGRGDTVGFATHAIAWYGSASSAVDLHQYLEGFEPRLTISDAKAVDSTGRIFGTAYAGAGQFYAVMWTPVPEPGTLISFCLGTLIMFFASRRRSS